MSATEWKFVPVSLTDEMGEIIARRGRMCGGGAFELWDELIAAAPVPPSVESLLENWTPSDQQAFARFRDQYFPGEMSSYAIQSLGSAWKDGQANAALSVWYGSMPESNGKTNWTAILHRKGECMSEGITIDRSEYPERVRYEADRMRHLIGELEQEPDVLAYDGDKHSGYVKPDHLTIPGALEWDGDNGTHGVVGTHSTDGESDYDDAKEACAEVERAGAPGDVIREMNDELVDLRAQLDDYKSKWLANCEALKLLGIHARHAEKLVKSCREKLEVDSVGKGFIEALEGFIVALDRDDNTHGDDGAHGEARQKACAACDGWGTISTGIDEAPSTNCKKCDGTGKGGVDE